jgi:arylsulfatase
MEAYAAMINHVDDGIGDLVAALKSKGQLENTLIFFLSDNGGDSLEHPNGRIGSTGRPWAFMRYVPLYTRDQRPVIAGDYPGLKLGPDTTYGGYGLKWAHLSNSPFRYYKKYAHEGGIATPLIAHWPKGIKRGDDIRHTPAHVIDIMATCLDAAGVGYPKESNGQWLHSLDGKSLAAVFKKDQPLHDSLCWEHHGNRAVRVGDWKLVGVENGEWELFDLKSDRTETRDLAAKKPDIVRRLRDVYAEWSRHCNVLPVSELKIEEIPDDKNPLTREPDEMREFLDTVNEALRKQKLPTFQEADQ